MFKKKANSESKEIHKEFEPKYPKPKILLIDLPDTALKKVQSAGFNAQPGTFGSPYKVNKSSSYQPIIAKPSLPNYKEQEIIIIDLEPPKTLNEPEVQKMTPAEEEDW